MRGMMFRQYVANHDPEVAGTDAPPSFDIGALHERNRLAAQDAAAATEALQNTP